MRRSAGTLADPVAAPRCATPPETPSPHRDSVPRASGTRPAAAAASTRNTAPAAPPARRPPAHRASTRPAVQPLVGVRLLRPLVEQLGEIADVAERVRSGTARSRRRVGRPRRRAGPSGPPAAERRAHRLRVVQPDQLAPLLLEIRHAHLGQRLERAGEPRPRPPRALGHAALLAAVARQEHDDAIGFTELVGAEDQRVGGVERHETRLFYVVHAA